MRLIELSETQRFAIMNVGKEYDTRPVIYQADDVAGERTKVCYYGSVSADGYAEDFEANERELVAEDYEKCAKFRLGERVVSGKRGSVSGFVKGRSDCLYLQDGEYSVWVGSGSYEGAEYVITRHPLEVAGRA